MASASDDIPTVNALFMGAASKFPRRPDAPTAANLAAAAKAPAPIPMQSAQQAQQQGAGGTPPQAGPYAQQPLLQVQQPPQQAQYVLAAPQLAVAPGQMYAPMPGVQQVIPLVSGGLPVGMPPPQQQQQQQQQQYGSMPSGGPQGQFQSPDSAPQAVQLPGPAGALPPTIQQQLHSIFSRSGGMLRPDIVDDRIASIIQVCICHGEKTGRSTCRCCVCGGCFEPKATAFFPPPASQQPGLHAPFNRPCHLACLPAMQ
jgi:hypothetical protein